MQSILAAPGCVGRYVATESLPLCEAADEATGQPHCVTMLYNRTSSRGIPVVYHDGTWGAICANGMSEDDATVVCRELGFYFGRVVPMEPGLKYDNLPGIRRTGMECEGTEPRLTNCTSFGVSTRYPCPSGVPAYVECSNTDNSESRCGPLQSATS